MKYFYGGLESVEGEGSFPFESLSARYYERMLPRDKKIKWSKPSARYFTVDRSLGQTVSHHTTLITCTHENFSSCTPIEYFSYTSRSFFRVNIARFRTILLHILRNQYHRLVSVYHRLNPDLCSASSTTKGKRIKKISKKNLEHETIVQDGANNIETSSRVDDLE